MRSFALPLLLLAACELQPAPRRQAPAAQTPPTPAPAPAAAPADAAVVAMPPRIETTKQCIDVGVHVAEVLINSADPAQRGVIANERERIVKATAEACTTQAWSDDAAKCYLAANTQPQLKACETKFTPPRPRTPTGPTPPPDAIPDEPMGTKGSVAPGAKLTEPGIRR